MEIVPTQILPNLELERLITLIYNKFLIRAGLWSDQKHGGWVQMGIQKWNDFEKLEFWKEKLS